jgi:hypothetical protein
VLVEYSWKMMKRRVQDDGLDAPSPKAAVREAAKLRLISEPDVWILCINARNASVHDYFGITREEFLELAKKLSILAERLQEDEKTS